MQKSAPEQAERMQQREKLVLVRDGVAVCFVGPPEGEEDRRRKAEALLREYLEEKMRKFYVD